MKWEDGRGGAMLIPDNEYTYELYIQFSDKKETKIAEIRGPNPEALKEIKKLKRKYQNTYNSFFTTMKIKVLYKLRYIRK